MKNKSFLRSSIQLLRHAFRNPSGVAAVEFALVLPILLLLFVGTIEITRFLVIVQKVDKVAYNITDIITVTPPVTTNPPEPNTLTSVEARSVLNLADDIMQPWGVAANTVVILTSVFQPAPAGNSLLGTPPPSPVIQWQIADGGSYAGTDAVSEFSGKTVTYIKGVGITPGTAAQFGSQVQASLTAFGGMYVGENFVAIEVFYNYTPLISFSQTITGGLIAPQLLKRRAIFSPRGNDSYMILPPEFQ